MKLFAAIRQFIHSSVGASPLPTMPPRDSHSAARAQMNAAVRRQEQYNFLHYDGTAQPDPVETVQL